MVFHGQDITQSQQRRPLGTRRADGLGRVVWVAQYRGGFAGAIIVACLAMFVFGCNRDDREATRRGGTSINTSSSKTSTSDVPQGESSTPNPSDTTTASERDPADLNTVSVELQSVDRGGLDDLIRGQKGKVVLVDFWATWCVPCVKGLPHTVELSKKYNEDDLLVVTLAMESAEQSAAVKATLESVDATGTHNLIANLDAFKAMDVFQISSGTLPTVRLYNRAGELVQTFGDGDPKPIDFQAIEVAIRGAL